MTTRPRWATGVAAALSAFTLLSGGFQLGIRVAAKAKAKAQAHGTTEARAPMRTDQYGLDPFTTSANTVAEFRAHGLTTACRLRAGVWESSRPDAGRFPPDVIGSPAPTVVGALPGETWRWLDIRSWDALRAIVNDRVALCAAKGFAEVIFTDLDGYAYETGFSLSRIDVDHFGQLVSEVAHAHGLAARIVSVEDAADTSGMSTRSGS